MSLQTSGEDTTTSRQPVGLSVRSATERCINLPARPDLESAGGAVASLLNERGGIVTLGVAPDGAVLGVPDAARMAQELRRCLETRLSPRVPCSVAVEVLDGKNVVVVDVPPGSDVPYSYASEISVREEGRMAPATSGPLSALIARARRGRRWEELTALGVELEDLDAGELGLLCAGLQDIYGELTQDPEALLTRLGLVESGMVRNCGAVALVTQVAHVYPQIRLRVACFAGDDMDETLDHRILEGHFFSLIAQAFAFLQRYLPISGQLPDEGLRCDDRPTYPWAALREGMLNALVHRDYEFFGGGVSVSIYPARVEIWNYGTLPEALPVDDLRRGGLSLPRNPDLAHLAYLRGYVERCGFGGRRIVTACRDAGLPDPEWEQHGGGVRLTLRLGRAAADAGDAWLSARQRNYLRESAPGDGITAQQYHQRYAADVTLRRARADLAELVNASYAARLGRGPATTYERRMKAEGFSMGDRTG